MGNWMLEVFRMGVYVSFPVVAFYCFNQPQFFEEWVIQTKQECFPPESKSHPPELKEAIAEFQRKHQEKLLKQLGDNK
ncbi:unnamed protein product [Notodromas monacha]|uniref:Protein PET100 homolog, mitochondrial n=1 Tax=Notodromas monacha TaxID=399045 RepID=A0A7R9GKR0_9CRUS|nr:unnamed protein product [Notodromas monacha]CAG0924897.1 unnamed protein product [Notodromas monacha]